MWGLSAALKDEEELARGRAGEEQARRKDGAKPLFPQWGSVLAAAAAPLSPDPVESGTRHHVSSQVRSWSGAHCPPALAGAHPSATVCPGLEANHKQKISCYFRRHQKETADQRCLLIFFLPLET